MRLAAAVVVLSVSTARLASGDVDVAFVAEPAAMAKVIAQPFPQLTQSFLRAHRGQSLRGTFRMCVGTDGAVESTSVLASVGDAASDVAVQRQLHDSWRFQPFDKTTCFTRMLVFVIPSIGGGPSSPVVPGQGMVAPNMPPSPDAEVIAAANEFIHGVVAGDLHAAYSRIGPGYRAALSESKFVALLAPHEVRMGKILDARVEHLHHSVQLSPAPGRNVWDVLYALRTASTPDWSHFMTVTIGLDPPLVIDRWSVNNTDPRGYDPRYMARGTTTAGSTPPQSSSGSNGPLTVPMFTLVSQKISATNPHLPDEFKRAHADSSVTGTYKVCIGLDGHVATTSVLGSVGAAEVDEYVMKQMRDMWLYKPQPVPVCFVSRLVFQIPAATTTPATP